MSAPAFARALWHSASWCAAGINPRVRPARFLLAALLVISAGGAVLLAQPWATETSSREHAFYRSRLWWRAALEATSATCGSGLSVGLGHADLTPAGQRVRLSCAILGGLAYLATALHLFQRAGLPVAGLGTALLMLGALLGLLIWHQAIYAPPWLRPTAHEEWAMCFALGWELPRSAPTAWFRMIFFTVVTLLGPAVLGLLRIGASRRVIFAWLAGYALWLVIAAVLLAIADGPRGRGASRIAAPPAVARFWDGLTDALLAAGPGVARSSPDEQPRALRQTLLAGVVLVGGMPGSLSGGLTFPLLALAAAAAWTVWCRRPLPIGQRAGLAVIFALSCWTAVVALGLILVEQFTASGFAPPPTLSDALLEAASAVGGAALTSGLTATLTDANLSSGMYQNVDLYPYGMTWLMLALLVGRWLPIAILARFTADEGSVGQRADAPPQPPPG